MQLFKLFTQLNKKKYRFVMSKYLITINNNIIRKFPIDQIQFKYNSKINIFICEILVI